MNYSVLLYKDEDAIFVAECVELPGCISQGKTKEEAIENVKDAIKGYLESLAKHPEEKTTISFRETIGLIPIKI